MSVVVSKLQLEIHTGVNYGPVQFVLSPGTVGGTHSQADGWIGVEINGAPRRPFRILSQNDLNTLYEAIEQELGRHLISGETDRLRKAIVAVCP